jgi:hypothetical protein
MSDSLIYILIVTGLLLSAGLSYYCLALWRKLRSARSPEFSRQEAYHSRQQHKLSAIQSIKIIAQCMLDDQVDLTEGCIRIKVMLDHVAPEFHQDPYFKIFSEMYAATQHMPTHQARKTTDKKQILKLDMERLDIEDANREAILAASRQLLSRLI